MSETVEVETWRDGRLKTYHRQGDTADGLETTELAKRTVALVGLSPCRTCYPEAYAARSGCRCCCGGCCCE